MEGLACADPGTRTPTGASGNFSTFVVPSQVWNTEGEDSLVMCSDILPTGLELGLLDDGAKSDDYYYWCWTCRSCSDGLYLQVCSRGTLGYGYKQALSGGLPTAWRGWWGWHCSDGLRVGKDLFDTLSDTLDINK